MSFEKIQLPDFLIADLYKSSLVDIAGFTDKKEPIQQAALPAQPRPTETLPAKVKYLGDNAKHVTVVVNEPGTEHLPGEDLTFLTNVLKACQLSLADIAIVNTAKQQVTYSDLKEQLKSNQILLFNVEPTAIKLPFMIPAFQIQKFDGCTIMLASALRDINKPTADGKLLKTKLWMSLKQVFGI